MGDIKTFSATIMRSDVTDNLVTVTKPDDSYICLYGILQYSANLPNQQVAVENLSPTEIQFNVGELPNGTHLIHVFYTI